MKLINAWVQKNEVISSWRNASGELRYGRSPAKYAGYIKDLCPELRDGRVVSVGEPDKFGWREVTWRDYDSRKAWLEQHNAIKTWEADLSPVKRMLADHPVEIAKPRRVYLDIETDSRTPVAQAITGEARILMYALRDDAGNEFQRTLTAFTDMAECKLIEELWETLDNYDQVVGWNSDSFDKLVIEERSKRYKLWPIRRLMWLDHLVCYKRMNLQVAGSGEEKTSFALNSVAQAVLGQGKHDFDTSQSYEEWHAGGDRRARMEAYNMQDVRLLPLIEAATGYLDAFQAICEVCHIFPISHNLKPTPCVDGYLVRVAKAKGERLPTRIDRGEIDLNQIEGAYVMPPQKSGMLHDVHVADFGSLYPSIMRTLNLCWTTKHETAGCTAPGRGVHFRQDIPGLIPIALAEFAEHRKVWKDKKKAATPGSESFKEADRYQNAFKVLSNSSYGILANLHSRYYDPDLAESITLTGQWLIKAVNEAARTRNLEPIYSDTDSCMITGCTVDEFAAFIKYCNVDLFPKMLADIGCKDNHIVLDFVETFDRLVFPVSDGELVSKRYVGRFSRFDGRSVADYAIEIKGLECKRGDSSRLARSMQLECIALLMGGWEYTRGTTLADKCEAFVADWRHIVTEGKVELDDIVISKGVKPPESYATRNKNGKKMALPMHVQIALQELEAGNAYPYRARYVITDGSTSPKTAIRAVDFKGEYDRKYIWERTYAATMRLLVGALPERNWSHFAKMARPTKSKPLAGQLGLDFG